MKSLVKTEQLEANKVKLTFEVDAQTFEKGMVHSYNKNKASLNVPGFRKGKAPRKLLEAQFGKEVFYDDAINFILPDAYESALEESGFKSVSRPDIDVENLDPATGIVFTAEIYTKPEATVENYKGIAYNKFDTNATDEEVESEVERTREKNSRLVTVSDRPVQDGDLVTIDFEGFVDGVAFEGGKAENYSLTIGSHTFVDTFEDQLIGRNTGEKCAVNVTFPDNYGNNGELSNKPAMFNVEVKHIQHKELPEVNDDFAQDVSEFDTLAEYKDSLKEKISGKKGEDAIRDRENQVMEKLIASAVVDVPEVMYDTQVEQYMSQLEGRLRQQGISYETYLKFTNQTTKGIHEMYRESAINAVKGRLALEAVAKAENMEVAEEDIDAQISLMAESYGMDVDKLKPVLRTEDMDMIKEDVLVEKALKLITDNAVEILA